MRSTVRPFIKEFKNRSSKSSAPHSSTADKPDKESPSPAFLDTGNVVASRNNHDDDYEAALKAADALFGKPLSPAAVLETASPSNGPVGRVLPSLIDTDHALADRIAEADAKPRRGRKPAKVESALPPPPKKPVVRKPKRGVAKVAVERPAEKAAPDIVSVSAGRRQKSLIQKRWVLRTELKAGQKWKRRLCKAAC